MWEQALAVFLEGEGRDLTPPQQEVLLDGVMPLLMAAASLTRAEAREVCRSDPLEIVLRGIGGQSIGASKVELVVDRLARQGSERQATARTAGKGVRRR